MIFGKRKSQCYKRDPVFHVRHTFRILSRMILFPSLLVFCIPADQALGVDITLAWNPNTETNLAGYKIYYDSDSGVPYNGQDADEGDSPVSVSLNQDENPQSQKVEFTLHNLPDNSAYYFTVTAFDDQGVESNYSSEVSTDDFMNPNGDDTRESNTRSGGGGCFVTILLEGLGSF